MLHHEIVFHRLQDFGQKTFFGLNPISFHSNQEFVYTYDLFVKRIGKIQVKLGDHSSEASCVIIITNLSVFLITCVDGVIA